MARALEDGAPAVLEAAADAQWGTGNDVFGVVVTNNGGSVYAQTKRFDSVMTGTHDAEGRATLAGTDVVMRMRNIKRAMGCLDADATPVGSRLQVIAYAYATRHVHTVRKAAGMRLTRAVRRGLGRDMVAGWQ